jgi:hypothetical protein
VSEKEPLALGAEHAALLGFSMRDFQKFANRARRLRVDLKQMEDDISEAALVHQQLLDALTRRLLQTSGEVAKEDLRLALDVLVVALKAHAEWRELITPIARKLGDQLQAQKKTARDARMRLHATEGKALSTGSAGGPADGDRG